MGATEEVLGAAPRTKANKVGLEQQMVQHGGGGPGGPQSHTGRGCEDGCGLVWADSHSDSCLLASLNGRNRKRETGYMGPYASTDIGMLLVSWLLEPEIQKLPYPKFCHLHEEMLAILRAK